MKLTLKQIRKIIILLIFFLLVGAGGYYLGERNTFSSKGSDLKPIINRALPLNKKNLDFDLFWKVWDNLETSYLDKGAIDYQKMIYGAISGMVASLGDPYTVFLPPSENSESKSDLRGDFEGVGIQIGYNKDQRLSVVAPLSGTPAESAGLRAGDIISRIVDEERKVDRDTVGISLPEAMRLIRGPKGSIVKLTLEREGVEKPFEVSLKRNIIVVKSVELKFEEKSGKKIAVLRLSRFGERTYDEWQEAVAKIKKENTTAVVLDLRNNPGGFLQGAIFVASEFLSSGAVVQQDAGAKGKETYEVNRKGSLLSEPLVVLINGGSASASEIVAGALQEKKRAILVGEKTFGKGTVQEPVDFEEGSGLHITIARWLLPSGKSIDKEGVKPDFEVKADEKDPTKDPQLQKAIEILSK